MNKKDAFIEINKLQDEYVDELIKLINSPDYANMKALYFTSATGTGKTKMMSKLVDRLPNYYFIITTLSKGQLNYQVKNSLIEDCHNNNFDVYGSADYRINSKLEANDIINKIPKGTQCIWLRDEGHILTNRYEDLLKDKCFKVINFSATNTHSDIQCNFTQTMMLRTVNQTTGTPKDAINKLLEIKAKHQSVSNYNPCAIFRCVGDDKKLLNIIVKLCKENKLKYINITEEEFIMSELCEDNNEYDVIINKMKLTEGIDIRRAHVLYMDNQPSNNATTIQAIGRCRRNALLYKDDIDIFAKENTDLLKATRECYVYYNVENMKINTDENGELQYAFCNYVSCQELKANTTIDVVDGQLANGLYVIELKGKTGTYNIKIDDNTGFNVVEPQTDFYDNIITEYHNHKYIYFLKDWRQMQIGKIDVKNIKHLPLKQDDHRYSTKPYYDLSQDYIQKDNAKCSISDKVMQLFKTKQKSLTKDYIHSKIASNCVDTVNIPFDYNVLYKTISEYMLKNQNVTGLKTFCKMIDRLEKKEYYKNGFTYLLSEICSDKELLLLKHFCIIKKEQNLSNEHIGEYVNNYVETKLKYYLFRYGSQQNLSLCFGEEYIDKSISDIKVYVEEYLKNNYNNKNTQFYKIVSNISNERIYQKVFYDLRRCCNKNELLLIQYCCIKAKEKKESNVSIIEHLNDIIQKKHKFYYSRCDEESEKITFIILTNDNLKFYNGIKIEPLTLNLKIPEPLMINDDAVLNFYNNINSKLEKIQGSENYFLSFDIIYNKIIEAIELTKKNLENEIVPHLNYSYNSLYEELTDSETQLINDNIIETHSWNILKEELERLTHYVQFRKTENDYESAIIGVDRMKQISNNKITTWVESKSVSSKIEGYNKLNSFLSVRYSAELEQAKVQYFNGKNDFDLDKKCNAMIGYCVEYYSKYLVYGKSYLDVFIKQAQKEAHSYKINERIIIRACMNKYKELMTLSYGEGVAKIIKGITIQQLVQEKYDYFVNLIIKLGTRTAEYVKKELYSGGDAIDNYDPNLSIRHISGLADYITADTILDVKVQNHIDEKNVRQVLAYHYLSTKRTDLNIKRLIVYDATSDRALTINLD